MLAGIYGMNFEHLPEPESPVGYPLVCGLLYRSFRNSDWP
jgi:magnesium transporter